MKSGCSDFTDFSAVEMYRVDSQESARASVHTILFPPVRCLQDPSPDLNTCCNETRRSLTISKTSSVLCHSTEES